MDEHTSKVDHLKQQIEAECQAMKQVLDKKRGKTSHDAISNRYKTLDSYHEKLKALIGDQEATMMVYEIYCRILQ